MSRTRSEDGPIAAFVIRPDGLVTPLETLHLTRVDAMAHDKPFEWKRIADGTIYVSCSEGHISRLHNSVYSIHRNGSVSPKWECGRVTEAYECKSAGILMLDNWSAP
jgi:hypothetical protein